MPCTQTGVAGSQDFVPSKIHIQFFLQGLSDIDFCQDAEAFYFQFSGYLFYSLIKRSLYYLVK